MKITINHISFWHAMQKQPSWAIRYHAERRKCWPTMFRHEEKRDRLKIFKLIPPEHTFDKDFHIENLMKLLKSCAGVRSHGMIEELSRLGWCAEYKGKKEERLCKKWLKRIMDWKEKNIINYNI